MYDMHVTHEFPMQASFIRLLLKIQCLHRSMLMNDLLPLARNPRQQRDCMSSFSSPSYSPGALKSKLSAPESLTVQSCAQRWHRQCTGPPKG